MNLSHFRRVSWTEYITWILAALEILCGVRTEFKIGQAAVMFLLTVGRVIHHSYFSFYSFKKVLVALMISVFWKAPGSFIQDRSSLGAVHLDQKRKLQQGSHIFGAKKTPMQRHVKVLQLCSPRLAATRMKQWWWSTTLILHTRITSTQFDA